MSFVASEPQFTSKTVETEYERKRLSFLVRLNINPQDLKTYYGKVEGGLRGAGFVLTSREAKWPAELRVKLPPAPAIPPASAAQIPAPAPVAQTPAAPGPEASVGPAPVAEVTATPAPAAVAEAPAPAAPPAPAIQAPTSTRTPAPAPIAEAPAVVRETVAQTPTPATETPASAPAAQEAVPEFAPDNFAQLTGAWAYSRADCDKLFQRRGKALAYRQPVDQFARAAIVEPQRIRLPSATCQLEGASQDGGALKVSADCQDSISHTSRTVYIKFKSDNEVTYSPTGDPVLATTLMRCRL